MSDSADVVPNGIASARRISPKTGGRPRRSSVLPMRAYAGEKRVAPSCRGSVRILHDDDADADSAERAEHDVARRGTSALVSTTFCVSARNAPSETPRRRGASAFESLSTQAADIPARFRAGRADPARGATSGAMTSAVCGKSAAATSPAQRCSPVRGTVDNVEPFSRIDRMILRVATSGGERDNFLTPRVPASQATSRGRRAPSVRPGHDGDQSRTRRSEPRSSWRPRVPRPGAAVAEAHASIAGLCARAATAGAARSLVSKRSSARASRRRSTRRGRGNGCGLEPLHLGTGMIFGPLRGLATRPGGGTRYAAGGGDERQACVRGDRLHERACALAHAFMGFAFKSARYGFARVDFGLARDAAWLVRAGFRVMRRAS